MASTALHLFPQSDIMDVRPPLRVHTSNGKQPVRSNDQSGLMQAASAGLSGVAIEVSDYNDISPIVLRSSGQPSQRYQTIIKAPQPVHERPSSPPSQNAPSTPTPVWRELPPEPQSPHFSTPQRVASHRLPRSSGSLRGQDYRRASPVSTQSSRSSSPTLVRRNSDVTERADTPMQTYPIKSMFPQLQPGIPLTQQPYAPVQIPSSGIPRQQISKGVDAASKPLTLQVPERPTEPGAILPPVASKSDCLSLWDLANGERAGMMNKLQFDIKCRTIQNGQRAMGQPGLELDILDDCGTNVYQARLAEKGALQADSKTGDLTIQRCHPTEGGTFPVTQMDCKLPKEGHKPSDDHDGCTPLTSIFPQIAALNAIRSVADSLHARHIAQFDPSASSPQAAQLAFDAVTGAKHAEESTLLYRPPMPTIYPTSSSSSAVPPTQGTYELHHPSLAPLAVAVEGRINLFDSRRGAQYQSTSPPRGRVVLRSPGSPRRRAVDLATLDLANDRLELDVMALCALDSLYMLDTAISALVAVAVAESFRPENGGWCGGFAAPPGTPGLAGKGHVRIGSQGVVAEGKAKRGMFGRSRGREGGVKEKQKERDAESIQLPTVTKGVLKLLGFSFQAIVWVLGLGVKVLVKLVSCMAGGKDKV